MCPGIDDDSLKADKVCSVLANATGASGKFQSVTGTGCDDIAVEDCTWIDYQQTAASTAKVNSRAVTTADRAGIVDNAACCQVDTIPGGPGNGAGIDDDAGCGLDNPR